MKPTVSINLCCYNSEKYLRETLDSIVKQTYKDWELIIINDGSTDATESIILEYKNQQYPIIYHYQENKGLGASRNEALKLSRGDYIAFIDHDDIWLPEKLEKQLPLFKNDKVGLVFNHTIMFNDKGDIKLFEDKDPPRGNIFRYLLNNYCISLESAVISRVALLSLDEWFDERFKLLEEGDLFKRIAYNWELDYINEPLSKWRVHKNSCSMNRYNELFPGEMNLMLSKFSTLFSDFESNYQNELYYLKAKIAYIRGLKEWQNNKKELRKHLKPYLLTQKKYLIPYMMSFVFPYSFYYYLSVKTNRFVR